MFLFCFLLLFVWGIYGRPNMMFLNVELNRYLTKVVFIKFVINLIPGSSEFVLNHTVLFFFLNLK